MAKSIQLSQSLGLLSALKIDLSGFEDSDLTKNGSHVFGLNQYHATSTDEYFVLRINSIGNIIHLVDVSDVEINGNPIKTFYDLVIFINSLV